MNDRKKIKHYIVNNELDLEKIVNEYSAYVGTIIDNMTKYKIVNEDKEDICADVFYILWRNVGKLNIDKPLSSYIAGVTKNVMKNYFKKNKGFYDISDYEGILKSENCDELFEDSLEEISKVESILKNMKEKDKKAFLDFYYYSKSIKDIAKELEVSEFSVKQRLYRIRNKIKKEVKKNG